MRYALGLLGAVLSIVMIAPPVQAQNYVPLDEGAKVGGIRTQASADDVFTKSLGPYAMSADIKSLGGSAINNLASFPECSPIPTLKDIAGAYETRRTLMSTSAASKLGLPFLSTTMTGSQMVMVQDYSRTTECLAADAKTRMVYGQSIRTLITIADLDVGADLTFAAIAANATITNKSNSVNVQVLGFDNPKTTAILAGIIGKELNVDTYADLAKVQSELMLLSTDPATTQSIRRLGVISDVDDGLKSQVAAAYALQQLKKGKACADAKASYKQSGTPSTIDEAYMLVMGTCSANPPNKEHRAKATRYLDVM